MTPPHVPEDAIIAVDVGNNTYSFGRYFECTRQSVLMSGYLGSIGFSLPAAIGRMGGHTARAIRASRGPQGRVHLRRWRAWASIMAELHDGW